MTKRQFPVLYEKTGPQSIDWEIIAPHAKQAMRNHDQTLEQLAERGGLCASEMCAVLEDRPWRKMTTSVAIARLEDLIFERTASGEAKT